MDITNAQIISYINQEGTNGVIDLNYISEEEVTIRGVTPDNSDATKEMHEFRYTKIILVKEDITLKKQALQKQLNDLS